MGLAHVVNRQGCHRRGGERLHLHPGLVQGLHACPDADGMRRLVGDEVDLDVGDVERVAHGDELRGPLGGHDAGNPRGFEHIALFHLPVADQFEGIGPHADLASGERRAHGRRLCGYIHHADAALFVEMREFSHRWVTSVKQSIPSSPLPWS